MRLHQIKSFCTAKEIINKMERKAMECEKIFANYISNKKLISKKYKLLIELYSKVIIIQFKSRQKT